MTPCNFGFHFIVCVFINVFFWCLLFGSLGTQWINLSLKLKGSPRAQGQVCSFPRDCQWKLSWPGGWVLMLNGEQWWTCDTMRWREAKTYLQQKDMSLEAVKSAGSLLSREQQRAPLSNPGTKGNQTQNVRWCLSAGPGSVHLRRERTLGSVHLRRGRTHHLTASNGFQTFAFNSFGIGKLAVRVHLIYMCCI